MQGKILNFDTSAGVGIISGNDGIRYNFLSDDFKSSGVSPRIGANVDFNTDGNDASDIYNLNNGSVIGELGEKNKFVAALLAFFLGIFGIHKFYLGKTKAAVIMLLCGTVGWLFFAIPPLIVGIIAFVEFILYLTKSDQDFYDQYVVGNKAWF